MNYALLCDLNAIKISFASLQSSFEQLDGKIVYSKFYNFNSKRNNEFSPYIRQFSADVAIPLSNSKKNTIDIRQVIDAISLACQNKNIDGFYIICRPLEAIHLIQTLRGYNKKIVLGVASQNNLCAQCDQFIVFDRFAGMDINIAQQNSEETHIQIEDEMENDNAIVASDISSENNSIHNIEKLNTFLPYTDIELDNTPQMEQIRDELAQMLLQKNNQKVKVEKRQKELEIQNLLKKYF